LDDAQDTAGPLLEHYDAVGDSEARDALFEVLPQLGAAPAPADETVPAEEVIAVEVEGEEEILIAIDEEAEPEELVAVVEPEVLEVEPEVLEVEPEPEPVAEVEPEPVAEVEPESEDVEVVELDLGSGVDRVGKDVDESSGAFMILDELERSVRSQVKAPAREPVEPPPASPPVAPEAVEEVEVEEPVEVEEVEVEEVEEPVEAGESVEIEEVEVEAEEPVEVAAESAAGEVGESEELVEISDSFAGPSMNDLQQIDFFIEQELFDDALRMLGTLEQDFPDDREVEERRLKLKSKGVLLEEVSVGEEAPEDLFAEEEDYFDLAKELEEELAEEEAMVEEATGTGQEEAELEEVFKEFQKGVAEQLSEEDSDTHFNLGIAYKEMGLLPEAIREFQIASRDSSYFIESCSMIGVCYVEQGMGEQAGEWYAKALQTPDLSVDAQQALRYDLASALEMAGDLSQAAEIFAEILDADPSYRDAAARLSAVSQQRQAN
jgi:tetratricopeptide (TPR) repeat protein